jgi:CBS domain-containing protein
MKVRELMTPKPLSCDVGTDLATVARLMAKADCGVLPVTDMGGKVTGIITDRDVCIAVAADDHPARQILAGAVAVKTVHTCRPDDDCASALTTMKKYRVRRLPVVNPDGTLLGMLSWSDAALAADENGRRVDPMLLVDAYKGICAHRRVRTHAHA